MILRTSTNIYQNDILVGESCDYPVILIGRAALCRVGLTTLHTSQLQASTLSTRITGIWNPIVTWYFNPNAIRTDHTKPSHVHPNIYEPTAERALVEYMGFHDYFDEGVLIEGLQEYLFRNNNNYQLLLEEARYWLFKEDIIEYWVKEAKEFCEV